MTFLLTGVERAELLWELAPDAAAAAVTRHHELIGACVSAAGGTRSGGPREGDAVAAAFGSAGRALTAALAIQRAMAAEEWPAGLRLRVRIGLYTGEVRGAGDRDLTAAVVHRCAALRDVAHGGQTLVSAATAALGADGVPEGTWLADLGMHRLRDLSRPEQLFELCHPDLPQAALPPRTLDVLPNNLPVQLTSFVGRSGELAEVERLLSDQRLVTLAGAGGCGKTRLAIQAAADLADRWPDGVWWVDLGPVPEPGLVAGLVASTLRLLVEPAAGPSAALLAQLRHQRLLLCLDTCEHVLDAAAELAGALLRGCPGVSVLATSREPLGVTGEAAWRVPSLAAQEARRLFADRAALVRPGASAAGEDEAVRELCAHLDGIPLAIELAAAWSHALTPAQIAAALDDRFRLLSGGRRGVIARHRTLAASMDWSHDLLEDADRVVFRRLAVFAGGFTLEAARAVCGAGPEDGGEAGDGTGSGMLAAVGRLVDKSLVVVQEDAVTGRPRYRMLDTVAQYAADRLRAAGEAAAVHERHLACFLDLAERAQDGFERDQDHWRALLESEHDNFRVALRWGLGGREGAAGEHGRRLAAALARLWFVHGHTREGIAFLRQAIDLAPGDRSALQARLLSGLALVALDAGRPSLAAESADRGLRIAADAGDDGTQGRCHALLAYGLWYTDVEATLHHTAQARRLGAAAGDVFAADFGVVIEANLLSCHDRHAQAAPLDREAQARCLARGERFCGTFTYLSQAYAALYTGDVPRGVALAAEAVRVSEPLGDYFAVSHAITNLAWFRGLAGDVDAGRRLMEPVVRSVADAGPGVQVPLMAYAPGLLHLWGGDLPGAVRWLELSAGFADPGPDNWIVARTLPALAEALRRSGRADEARKHAERAVELARRLDVPHALADALQELAFLAASDDPHRAEQLHHEALAVRAGHGLRTFSADSLDALAGLAAKAGGAAEAARLLAAADTARERVGYPRPPVRRPEHDAVLAEVRTALGDDAFAGAWAEGAALTLDDAVGYVRRARGSRGRPATGWASLTPTERQVVGLVVEGLTNPQIGARLFMSRATVKTHLSHVYAKLGIVNRTELATFAGRRT